MVRATNFTHGKFTFSQINSTNFISQKFIEAAVILAVSESKRCTLDLSVVKAQGLIARFLFFYHSAIPEKFH